MAISASVAPRQLYQLQSSSLMDTFTASEKLVVFLGRGSLNQHRFWFGKNLPIRFRAPLALLITGTGEE